MENMTLSCAFRIKSKVSKNKITRRKSPNRVTEPTFTYISPMPFTKFFISVFDVILPAL